MADLATIERALRKADAAGDSVASRRLAQLYQETQQAQAQPQERTLGEDVARQLGLTARAGAEGLAGLAGLAYDPIAAGLNLGAEAIGYEGRAAPLQQQVRGLLSQAGVPEPESTAERIVQAASQGLVGGGGGVAAARGAGRLATGPIGQQVTQALAAGPYAQVVGGGGAGAAGQAAQEVGVGPVGQIAASLAGGIATGAPVGIAEQLTAGRVPQAAQDIIQAGAREGVPVMTTDVIPPTTAAGRLAQQAGEKTPQ